MSESSGVSAPLHGSLLERIQERYGSLRKSERVVADYLRDNAGTRLDSSITELGRKLGVSEATISRVSRALGYEGFPDLKLSVAEGARPGGAFANIPVEIAAGDSPSRPAASCCRFWWRGWRARSACWMHSGWSRPWKH